MAARDPVIRFRFDFADLKRPGPVGLRLLAPALDLLPAGGQPVAAVSRPGWLPRLLPAIRTCEPLRVAVLGAEAPVWATRVCRSLACLFKSAGAEGNLSVFEWPGGFVVGTPGSRRMPLEPHAVLVAAELDMESIAAAVQIGRTLDARRAFLTLHGESPALEARLGLNAAGSKAPVHRLPTLETADIAALQAGQLRRDFGRACLGLAGAILTRYREPLT